MFVKRFSLLNGNQTVSSMFEFNSFIRMVRIHTFLAVWIEELGPIVASSFFSIARVAQDLVTLHMKFSDT